MTELISNIADNKEKVSAIHSCFNPFAFTFSTMETPSSVWISSVKKRRKGSVPEHALMNEPG